MHHYKWASRDLYISSLNSAAPVIHLLKYNELLQLMVCQLHTWSLSIFFILLDFPSSRLYSSMFFWIQPFSKNPKISHVVKHIYGMSHNLSSIQCHVEHHVHATHMNDLSNQFHCHLQDSCWLLPTSIGATLFLSKF